MLKIKKLALHRETVRVLTKPELQGVVGAMPRKDTWLGGTVNTCSYTDHNSPWPCDTELACATLQQ